MTQTFRLRFLTISKCFTSGPSNRLIKQLVFNQRVICLHMGYLNLDSDTLRQTFLASNCCSRNQLKYSVVLAENPEFCICKNKGADQLCGNCTADQRLCFSYIVKFLFFLNPKFQVSSHLLWLVLDPEYRFSHVAARLIQANHAKRMCDDSVERLLNRYINKI